MTDPRPEFAYIHSLRGRGPQRSELSLGIGDDAAIFSGAGNWVATKDVLTAGVHFLPDELPELIGRKALAVNLSDIAAMAATPCLAFVGIVVPRSWSAARIQQLTQGLLDLATEFDVALAGGDTNSWDGPLVISVTLLGRTGHAPPVLRSGAKPGDRLLVTGPLGGSLASGRHLSFTPRVREALALKESATLHALLDLSDGLASDLFHLLEDSGVGAVLDGEAIPIHEDVPLDLSPAERRHHALSDGEDFELLLAVPPEAASRLLASPPTGVTLFDIGEVTTAPGAWLKADGQLHALQRTGWAHSFSG